MCPIQDFKEFQATEGAEPGAGSDDPPEKLLDVWELEAKSKTATRFVTLGPPRGCPTVSGGQRGGGRPGDDAEREGRHAEQAGAEEKQVHLRHLPSGIGALEASREGHDRPPQLDEGDVAQQLERRHAPPTHS